MNLQLLSVKDHWLCDRTFNSAPLGFQLYTVHVMIDASHTVPLVYCIARNKNQATYDLIFTVLKQVRSDLNPASVTLDFEKAALNSIASSFPNTTVYGCFFPILGNAYGEKSNAWVYRLGITILQMHCLLSPFKH